MSFCNLYYIFRKYTYTYKYTYIYWELDTYLL